MFRESPNVASLGLDGQRVLLDFRTGRYLVFDEIAAAFWSVLTGQSDRLAVLETLERLFQVEPEEFDRDLGDFARSCISRGLLERETGTAVLSVKSESNPKPESRHRLWRGWHPLIVALISMRQTRLSVSTIGFSIAHSRLRLQKPRFAKRPLAELLKSFGRAEQLFWNRRAPHDCLVRSLSLYQFLTSYSIPAEHVIGVRLFPFHAHAWVEVDGTPILDTQGIDYRPLVRLTTA